MSTGEPHPAAARAGAEFDRHEARSDGEQIADRLMKHLTALRESLLRRVVAAEESIPVDSMLMPVSKLKAQQQAAEEVEAFMAAESAKAAARFGFSAGAESWYAEWLLKMRLDSWNPLGDVSGRVREYLAKTDDQRRLEFSNVLVEAIPESRHAPLVLFRLLPTAVHVATALAFDDAKAAGKVRTEQMKILPSIAYCHECQGELLADERECSTCGNPLWNQEWLCEAD